MPKNETSKNENRSLAQKPYFLINGMFNENFGSDTENWLKDQFPFRKEIIKAQFQTMFKINGKIENEKAFMLKNGWAFDRQGTTTFISEEEQNDRINGFKEIFDKLYPIMLQKDVSIIVLLLPDRGWFYHFMWERFYFPRDRNSWHQRLMDLFHSYAKIKVIYPLDELKSIETENKKAFEKDDDHYSWEGIATILQKLYDELKSQYFPDQNIEYELIPSSDKALGNGISAKLGFERKHYSPSFHLEAKIINKEIKLKEKRISSNINQAETFDPIVDKSLYLFGVCYTGRSLFPLYKYFFKKTTAYTEFPVSKDKDKVIAEFSKAIKNMENDSILIFIVPELMTYDYITTLQNSLKEL